MKVAFVSLAAALIVGLAGCQPGSEQEVAEVSSPTASAQQDTKLNPLPGKQVPAITEVTTIRLATTGGDVVVEVYPQAAPNAPRLALAQPPPSRFTASCSVISPVNRL